MTIFGILVTMSILWLILAIIFLIVESLTVGLTTIWFAAGAAVALLLSVFDFSLIPQVISFFIVSIGLLVFTRKIFVEKLKTGAEKTNLEALIGDLGIVINTIEPLVPGQVRLKGQIWSAICKEKKTIEKGSFVIVESIEGVKLVVSRINED